MKSECFTHFVGIDWSGAKGKRHNGLQVALAERGNGAPKIIRPLSGSKAWSREEVAHWVISGCGCRDDARVLVGIDAAFSMPYLDHNVYLPNTEFPHDAKTLWQKIAEVCAGDNVYFGGAFAKEYADYFLRHEKGSVERGKYYSRRMRVTETLSIKSGAGPCESVFHLIGPSQVGKSALSTMCMLADIAKHSHIVVWPFDNVEQHSICFVEIYAALFAQMGGHRGKVRDKTTLNAVLERLLSGPYKMRGKTIIDDAADAIITAAGLRFVADNPDYWKPELLSPKVRKTEGWIFGLKG